MQKDGKDARVEHLRQSIATGATVSMVFLPGLLLLGLGAVVIVAPTFVAYLVAIIFAFLGALFCIAAWKFMTLKKKFEGVVRDLGGRVYVQGVSIGQSDDFDIETEIDADGESEVNSASEKKITYH